MKTEFSKQDLISLCNNFAAFFNGLLFKNDEHTEDAKDELLKVLEIDQDVFCLLVLKITKNKIDVQNKTTCKISNITKLHLTENEIVGLAIILAHIAQNFDGSKKSSISLMIPFVNYLYNILNLDRDCCKDFVTSLRYSVDPDLN